MIDWKQPIVRKRDGTKARWIGTIHRSDGLNFVVATTTKEGDEEVGCYTVTGSKLDTGKWDLANAPQE